MSLIERLRAKKSLDIGSTPHLDGSRDGPQLVEWFVNPDGPEAATQLEAMQAEIERLRKSLEFYANPEIYKPHPHGPAFDNRDLSFKARASLSQVE